MKYSSWNTHPRMMVGILISSRDSSCDQPLKVFLAVTALQQVWVLTKAFQETCTVWISIEIRSISPKVLSGTNVLKLHLVHSDRHLCKIHCAHSCICLFSLVSKKRPLLEKLSIVCMCVYAHDACMLKHACSPPPFHVPGGWVHDVGVCSSVSVLKKNNIYLHKKTHLRAYKSMWSSYLFTSRNTHDGEIYCHDRIWWVSWTLAHTHNTYESHIHTDKNTRIILAHTYIHDS